MKIEVRVKPNSKTEEVIEEGNIFVVKVKEPPTEGKANRAAIGLLAKHFGVSATRLRISKGLKSRTKVIEIL
jgi:uncharacterized protein (TIGR00251 family)